MADSLAIPPHFNKKSFLATKALEAVFDQDYLVFSMTIEEYLPIFLQLLQRVNWRDYTGEFNTYPYQIIGGFATKIYQRETGITLDPFPPTPDIDVEFNTVLTRGDNGQIIMEPFLLDGEINPVYVGYGRKLYTRMATILESIQILLKDLIPQLEHPDPMEDSEAKHQEADYNMAIGPFHISLILNKEYISKILIFTKYRGRHYHIFDLQFTTAKTYIKKPPLLFKTSYSVYVAPPDVLLEKNVTALLSRYVKKIRADDELESMILSADLQNNMRIKQQQLTKIQNFEQTIRELNRKVINHTLRISFLMKIISQIYQTSPEVVGTLDAVFDSSNPHSILKYKYQNLAHELFYDILSRPENRNILATLYGSQEVASVRYSDLERHVIRYRQFIDQGGGGKRRNTRRRRFKYNK